MLTKEIDKSKKNKKYDIKNVKKKKVELSRREIKQREWEGREKRRQEKAKEAAIKAKHDSEVAAKIKESRRKIRRASDERRTAPLYSRCQAFWAWLQLGSNKKYKTHAVLRSAKALEENKMRRAATVVRWLRRRSFRRLRKKRECFHFFHKRTKQNYYISKRSTRKYRFKKHAMKRLKYTVSNALHRPRPVWKPYAPTLRGLWNFFENYRKYQCRWWTHQWRQEQLVYLAKWVRANIRFKGTSKFLVLDTIYHTLQSAATIYHPEELRARRAQKQIIKLSRRYRISTVKPQGWLHTCFLKACRVTNRSLLKNSPSNPNGVNWTALTRQFRRILPAKRTTVVKRPRPPFKLLLSRPRKLAVIKSTVNKYLMSLDAISSRRRRTRCDRRRRKVSKILWQFFSPEFRFRSYRLLLNTRKGVRPTKKRLIRHLKASNWLSFTSREPDRDCQKKYSFLKGALVELHENTTNKGVKPVWSHYHNKKRRKPLPQWVKELRKKRRKLWKQQQKAKRARSTTFICRTAVSTIKPLFTFPQISLFPALQQRHYSTSVSKNKSRTGRTGGKKPHFVHKNRAFAYTPRQKKYRKRRKRARLRRAVVRRGRRLVRLPRVILKRKVYKREHYKKTGGVAVKAFLTGYRVKKNIHSKQKRFPLRRIKKKFSRFWQTVQKLKAKHRLSWQYFFFEKLKRLFLQLAYTHSVKKQLSQQKYKFLRKKKFASMRRLLHRWKAYLMRPYAYKKRRKQFFSYNKWNLFVSFLRLRQKNVIKNKIRFSQNVLLKKRKNSKKRFVVNLEKRFHRARLKRRWLSLRKLRRLKNKKGKYRRKARKFLKRLRRKKYKIKSNKKFKNKLRRKKAKKEVQRRTVRIRQKFRKLFRRLRRFFTRGRWARLPKKQRRTLRTSFIKLKTLRVKRKARRRCKKMRLRRRKFLTTRQRKKRVNFHKNGGLRRWQKKRSILASSMRTGMRFRSRRFLKTLQFLRRMRTRRVLKETRWFSKLPVPGAPLTLPVSSFLTTFDRTAAGALHNRKREKKPNRRRYALQYPLDTKVTNWKVLQQFLILQLGQQQRSLSRERTAVSLARLDKTLATLPELRGGGKWPFWPTGRSLKKNTKLELLFPLNKALHKPTLCSARILLRNIAQQRAAAQLAATEKNKHAIVLQQFNQLASYDPRKHSVAEAIQKTNARRKFSAIGNKYRARTRRRRNLAITFLKNSVAWTVEKTQGQHRSYRNAVKKTVRHNRGRFWFKGYKRKPTKNKRRHALVLAHRLAVKRFRRLATVRKFTQTALQHLKVKTSSVPTRSDIRNNFRLRALLKNRASAVSHCKHKFVQTVLKNFTQTSESSKLRLSKDKLARKSKNFWHKLKKQSIKEHLCKLPYFVPQYRLRTRLAAGGYIRYLSQNQQTAQKNNNKDRFIAALELHKERRKSAALWNKQNFYFKWPSSVSDEEQFKRNIHRTWSAPSLLSPIGVHSGYPATKGVRRFRRVFAPAYNTSGRVKLMPVPAAYAHPAALISQKEIAARTVKKVYTFKNSRVKVINGKTLLQREYKKYNPRLRKDLLVQSPSALSGKKRKNKSLKSGALSSIFTDSVKLLNWDVTLRGLVKKRAISVFSVQNLNTVISSLNVNSPLWIKYGEKYSAQAVAAIQFYFVMGARRWLNERPFEKFISGWTQKDWQNFKNFVKRKENTLYDESVRAFHLRFIAMARKELFAKFPNWWEQEARVRAKALLEEINLGTAPGALTTVLSDRRTELKLFEAQAGAGYQEKKAFAFFATQSPSTDASSYFFHDEQHVANNSTIESKTFASVYYRWLSSVETHLKKTQTVRSSQDYNNLRSEIITVPGIDQPRFPGAGRQKKSFDALLRHYYSRVLPLRQKLLNRRTIKKLRPKLSERFIVISPRLGSTAALRQKHKMTKNMPTVAYLTSKRREHANRIKTTTAVYSTRKNLKSRLASLPLSILKTANMTRARRERMKERTSFTGVAEALMHVALKKRFVTRRIRDLRKSCARRKLTKSQSLPFWIQRKLDKKQLAAAEIDRYKLANLSGRGGSKSPAWTFSEFAVQMPRKRARLPQTTTVFGERVDPTTRVRRTLQYAVQRHSQLFGVRTLKPRKFAYNFKTRVKISRKQKYKKRKNRRKGYKLTRKNLVIRTERKLLHRFEKAQRSLHYKLVKNTRPQALLSPLHFYRPTARVFATTEDKERLRLYTQSTRLRKYRRLTELSDTLTSFFPQLISWFMEKKMKNKIMNPKIAANWVAGIYWSLRFYLDEHKTESYSREIDLEKFHLLRKEITAHAEKRYFDFSSVRTARYRFQPHSLHRAGSLQRGAFDWLRQFIPKFYELHLEDPEKYKHLTLTPIKVFRSHLSYHALKNKETRNVPGTLEQRYRRLTTPRYGKNSTRFENMLMTTRRAPVLGGYGAAAKLKVISPIGFYKKKHPFFPRHFSTLAQPQQADRNWKAKMLADRLQLLRRHVVTENQATTHATSATVYSSMKARAVAKIRTHYTEAEPTGVSLDLRLTRAKSPRSGDYVRRLSKPNTNTTLTANTYGSVLFSFQQQRSAAANAFRDNRNARSVFVLNKIITDKSSSSTLQEQRKETLLRRVGAFLQSRQRAEIKVPTVTRRFYIKKKRAKSRNSYDYLQKKSKKLCNRVESSRSVLHFRRASARNPAKFYKFRPAILTRAIQLRRRLWRRLVSKKSASILCEKYKTALQKSRRQNFQKKNLVKFKFYSDKKRPVLTRKQKKTKVQHKKSHLFKKKLKASTRKVVVGRRFSVAKRLFASPTRKRLALTLSPKVHTTASTWKTKKYLTSSNFIQHAKAIKKNTAILSKYLNRLERKRSRALFSERRPELWDMLTKRRNKKFRYLKRWLRNIKYAFKQHYWSYEGQHILPDELFKLSRLRLKKLDWRESDELFERHGLRHAFSFHPRVRLYNRWLEPLMRRRSLYNLRRGEYRRYQFPGDQKHRQWLEELNKRMYKKPIVYTKGRRWPLLRMYIQRLYRSLFHLRNKKAALKRFRKTMRRNPGSKESGFEKRMVGFGNRLDVNLILLGIAPTTYWAREMSQMGLLRVNGKIIRDKAFRFQPGDWVELLWEKIKLARINFKSPFRRRNRTSILQETSFRFPGNYDYSPKLRAARYMRLPQPEDLPTSGRLNEALFRGFHLDSGLGR